MAAPEGALPGGDPLLGHRYRILRRLLAANSEMLELMADLEADLAHFDPGEPAVVRPVLRLLDGSLLLAENLNLLTGVSHRALYGVQAEIEEAVRATLRSFPAPWEQEFVLPLAEAGPARIREVGGKAAGLGPILTARPELVPPGFVVTTAAYRFFLSENRLQEPIRRLFRNLSLITGRRLFQERTREIRELIERSPVPGRVLEALATGLRLLGKEGETPPERLAVRSSAVGEDGRMSFAGQFETLLDVGREELAPAYRRVLASRWSDHAVLYRLAGGFTEAETPMAVLVMPMLEARAAGVLYTRDPRDEAADRMLIDSVAGPAGAMVRGEAAARTLLARRNRPGEIETTARSQGPDPTGSGGPLSARDVKALVETGLLLEAPRRGPLDIEWVVTPEGALRIVQCRPLRTVEGRAQVAPPEEGGAALTTGGITIFPGLAAGPVHRARTAEELLSAPEGALLVVHQAGPELAAVLPGLAGVVAEHGNPAGHAAALVREFGVPTLFGVEKAVERLGDRPTLSLDATRRLVFDGALWPDVIERVRSRIRHQPGRRGATTLHDRVLALNLTNPQAIHFRARSCRSVHDIVRFTHEKAVAAMFELGDEAGRLSQRQVCRLESRVPLPLSVLDLGGTLPAEAHERRTVRPEEIASAPFQALWRGMTRPGVSWAGRAGISLGGFLSVIGSSISDSRSGVREVGGRNYLMVAPDYVNLNARLAYHFAMVDAFVSPVPENNFVNFRFRGGGAGTERRELRARFLAEVLHRSGFGVDRRGDLVTAWLRRYPQGPSEEALATLGALMGCARQLDMLMQDESSVRLFVEHFLNGDYAVFT